MIALAEFTVAVNKKEVVAAALPLQEHWLPLSNLDLLLPPLDVGVFFCYKNDDDDAVMSFGSMVGVLKKAMAQALVSYYALAGEIVSNPTGEPELLCNNRGVEFFEAYADVELRDLNLYEPDKSIEGKLVPEKKKNEVLSVQVTELKCGSLVVACTFDHRIADGYSINMFLVSWAEMARSKPISLFPSFRRSLLNPRRPLNIDSALDDVYVPISTLPPPPTSKESDHDQCHHDDDGLTSRIYYITSDQLDDLQSLASYSNGDNINGSCHKRTKLESFSAFLWKMVACEFAHDHKEKENNKSKTKGKKPHDMISRMGIVVDGRTRLNNTHHEGDINDHNLMDSYFGNVLSIPYGGQNISQLIKEPLSWVADQVNDLLHDAVTKDHFFSLIDWVETHRPEPAVAKIYCRGSEDGPAFVVSSGQRFPVEKVDFGWGKPVFGSYHFPWGGSAGYVMPMPSPKGNGDWVVYMHMTKRQLDFIEKVASKIFKPLTNDYLSLVY